MKRAHCVTVRTGAGTARTTFHAWAETAPSVISLSPSSGSGLSQQFTWTASSPSGYANLAHVYALFNTSDSGAYGCYIYYSRGGSIDRASRCHQTQSPSSPGALGTSPRRSVGRPHRPCCRFARLSRPSWRGTIPTSSASAVLRRQPMTQPGRRSRITGSASRGRERKPICRPLSAVRPSSIPSGLILCHPGLRART